MSVTNITEKKTVANGQGRNTNFVRLILEGRAFFALIVIIAVFSFLSPYYFTLNNFLIMASHVAIFGILAIGMLVVILNGGIDLSVGSTLGLAGCIAGFLMQGVTLECLWRHPVPAGLGRRCHHMRARRRCGRGQRRIDRLPARAGLRCLARCTLRGPRHRAADDQWSDLQQSRRAPELGNTGFDWLGFNRLGGVPIGVIVLAVLAIICGLVLSRTAFGRWLYASGGNERAADLSGVPVKRVKITVYVLSGVCAAIAGLVLSSQLTSAGPTAGTTYELTAIAAVVIGGAALTGGRGTVRGTMLGAFVIGFLSDGLVIIGVSAYWQTVFTGAVIVLAVLMNSIQYGRRVKST